MIYDFIPGEQIDGFELRQQLKKTRTEECWFGFLTDGKPAVLKCLRPPFIRERAFWFIADFLENDKSGMLLRVFRTGKSVTGMPFAIMEYASGGSLRNLLRHRRKLPLNECCLLFRNMLLALVAVNRGEIVHRDIKPENILLMRDGSIRLADFGIAKVLSVEEEPGKVFGTASYISPEQAQDSCHVDIRSDLYSTALVILEVLTGEPLRPRGKFVDILKKVILNKFPVPEQELRNAATDSFAELLMLMLEYDRNLRPPSPEAVLEAFDKLELPLADRIKSADSVPPETAIENLPAQ